MTEVVFYTASWSKETALMFVATKVALTRQEATPGHCQSCCSLPQDEASCPLSAFLCSPNSSLAFLSLLSGSQRWIQKKENQSWSPVTIWLSRTEFSYCQEFLNNCPWLGTTFFVKSHRLYHCPWLEEESRPSRRPQQLVQTLSKAHSLFVAEAWVSENHGIFTGRGLNWLWISDANCTQQPVH